MRLQCSAPIIKLSVLAWFLFTAGIGWVGPAAANPLPGGVMLIHVAPPDPEICSNGTVTTCEQITQYTTETGVLEFTLFLYSYLLSDGVTGVEGTLEWPADWQFIEGELCGVGEGSFETDGLQASIAAYFDSPDPGVIIQPCARLLFDVSGYGELTAAGEFHMRWGLPPDEGYESIGIEPGQAGVECSYRFMYCDFESPCRPIMDPEQLMFELSAGESSQQTILAHSPYEPQCWSSFDAIGDWLGIAVEDLGNNAWNITVTADATGLDFGEYVGWVRGEAQAPRCTRVTLFVTEDAQGIPDDWGSEEVEEETAPTTWGEIKSRYR